MRNEPENWIYFHHLNKLCWIPTYPEQTDDGNSATFGISTPLGRSAPIQSWSGSGPRSVVFPFDLHKDSMLMINSPSGVESSMLIDDLIDSIEASCIPTYEAGIKMINPPQVTVNIAKQTRITGVVTGRVNKRHHGQWRDGKQLQCYISFTVSEIEPFDARTVALLGGYRGIRRTLENTVKRG